MNRKQPNDDQIINNSSNFAENQSSKNNKHL